MKWRWDTFWPGIFLAKLGPLLVKNSLNLLLISVPSEIIVPSLNLNLAGTFLVLFLFTIFFIICHDFLYYPCESWTSQWNAAFQHTSKWYLIYFDIFYVFSLATVLHFKYFLYNLFLVLMTSFNPWVSHNLRVLYFMLTFCFGKCLLYTFSSTEEILLNLPAIKVLILSRSILLVSCWSLGRRHKESY